MCAQIAMKSVIESTDLQHAEIVLRIVTLSVDVFIVALIFRVDREHGAEEDDTHLVTLLRILVAVQLPILCVTVADTYTRYYMVDFVNTCLAQAGVAFIFMFLVFAASCVKSGVINVLPQRRFMYIFWLTPTLTITGIVIGLTQDTLHVEFVRATEMLGIECVDCNEPWGATLFLSCGTIFVVWLAFTTIFYARQLFNFSYDAWQYFESTMLINWSCCSACYEDPDTKGDETDEGEDEEEGAGVQ